MEGVAVEAKREGCRCSLAVGLGSAVGLLGIRSHVQNENAICHRDLDEMEGGVDDDCLP